MSPHLIKMNIEHEIDEALKVRAILFEHQERERLYSHQWRSHQVGINNNTRKISALRAKWRQINKLK